MRTPTIFSLAKIVRAPSLFFFFLALFIYAPEYHVLAKPAKILPIPIFIIYSDKK